MEETVITKVEEALKLVQETNTPENREWMTVVAMGAFCVSNRGGAKGREVTSTNPRFLCALVDSIPYIRLYDGQYDLAALLGQDAVYWGSRMVNTVKNREIVSCGMLIQTFAEIESGLHLHNASSENEYFRCRHLSELPKKISGPRAENSIFYRALMAAKPEILPLYEHWVASQKRNSGINPFELVVGLKRSVRGSMEALLKPAVSAPSL